MSPPYLIALISGTTALWLWALVVYWREKDTCHGETNAPATQHGVCYGYGSFAETEVYATSAGYRALTKSIT